MPNPQMEHFLLLAARIRQEDFLTARQHHWVANQEHCHRQVDSGHRQGYGVNRVVGTVNLAHQQPLLVF